MSNTTIYDRIVNIIDDQKPDADFQLTLETSLRNDLNVDSIELMAFVIALEDEFGITIPDEDVDHLDNMKDLILYLEHRLNNNR